MTILFQGRCSTFGGPHDSGMRNDEGLALIHYISQRPEIFLSGAHPTNIALGHLLNPDAMYIACPWNYHVTTPGWLLMHQLRVTSMRNNTLRTAMVWPADWGPNPKTGRIADLSPGAAKVLGVDTGDIVKIEIP